jgi:hypothetical protein
MNIISEFEKNNVKLSVKNGLFTFEVDGKTVELRQETIEKRKVSSLLNQVKILANL